MRSTVVGTLLLFFAAAIFALTNSPATRESLGAATTALVRPVVIPAVELINYPAFVYCASFTILAAGLAACATYRFRSVGPRLAALRAVRRGIFNLPAPPPQALAQREAWPQARQMLGAALQQHSLFVSSWSVFQSESMRTGGVPSRTFSSFVAAEGEMHETDRGLMHSLPGYFTSLGLIFTFIGLVVALYFAAKGFRTGDMNEARAAIIKLLNAASFKFLTSVSALISALIISLYLRYATSVVSFRRLQILEQIEIYLAEWRERIGTGIVQERLDAGDLLHRFDALLASVQSLSEDVRRLVRTEARQTAPRGPVSAKAHDVAV